MKSTVEKLSPTRVRINVEVPFTELEPDFDRAFKQLAKQVRLPGFRPGKAPAQAAGGPHRPRRRARAGRQRRPAQPLQRGRHHRRDAAARAARHRDHQARGRRGTGLHRRGRHPPRHHLPDLEALKIAVDPIEVTDEDVDTELQNLRARFGTLTGVERAAENGDFVSIDLSATVDGEDVPEAKTEGLSHEVGSGQLIEGLDDAIVGLKEGETKVFTTTLAAGEHAGEEAQVTVTVKSVKERELPEPDDEFAQLASEFDTIDELKASLTEQVERVKRVQQAEQIRDKALEALLEQVDVPLPENDRAGADRRHRCTTRSTASTTTRTQFAEALEEQGSSREEFDADNRTNAEKAVKTQLLMDAIADKLDIQVGQNDLTERLVLMSRQYGIEPQQLLQSCSRTTSCRRCSPTCAAA